MRTLASLSLLLVPLAACTFRPVTGINPAPEVVATERFEQVVNNSADILLVVDNSGSMAEEQFNLMANIAKFVDTLDATGADLRFAAVTTDADINPDGNFFQDPDDTRLSNGQLQRAIPKDFCNGVIQRSQNGVLSPGNGNLTSFIDGFGQIEDFTGRQFGTFQDANGDKHADNLVQASFPDAVGCLISAGIVGSGAEVGLCQAAAALDQQSLNGSNSAFLSDPDSVLAVIILGDEDDCTENINEQGGKLTCRPPTLNSQSGSLKCSQPAGPICGTSDSGLFDNLVGVDTFAQRIKQLRSEEKLFVATITGPPGPALPDCDLKLPVPTCFAAASGSASPGNRMFQFANQFQNHVDGIEAAICGNFAEIIEKIADDLGQLLNAGCLNAPVDANINQDTDVRVVIDITNAVGVNTCGDIGPNVATDLGNNLCEVNVAAREINANAGCASGFEISFVGFTPPTGSIVTIEYISKP